VPSPLPRRRLRQSLVAAALVLLALLTYAFIGLGPFMAAEDPLEHADVIFVLAGTRIERPLEAVDLYREGWAPRIVLTHQKPEAAASLLARRGVVIPADEDIARDALIDSGVPAAAIELPARLHDNTAQEAQTLRELARRNGWHRAIVVTSKFHLRRAGFAMRRELAGDGLEIIMRGSRYDLSRPERWWASRADIRWMMSEGPKLVAYFMGLGA
jgi:uncharacterized SAM-binding protein YcdF (DUF218 family)